MSYNRWMPPECSTELYHHGVKGMKWGKHLFGKSADIQVGAGGGGGSNEEDLKLLEELKKKYGDKALEMFKKIKQQQQAEDGRYGTLDKLREKITGKADPDNIKQVHDRVYERTLKGAKATKYSGAKSESDEEYASRSAKETAEKTKEYIKEHSIAGAIGKAKKKLDGVTREKRIPEKKIKQRAAGVPKTVGLTDYTEYKKAQKDYEKLLKDYNDKYVDDHPATYLKPSDEKKKAKQKLGSAEFHRDVQKEQYEQTPLGKTVSKAESGMKKVQQMVRDIKGDRKGTRTKLQNRRRR